MNEKKLIEAFSKIKRDMNYLSSEIDKIKKVNDLSSEIKTQIEQIKKFNLEKFTKTQEIELKNLNKFITNFDSKILKSENKIVKFENLVKGYSNEVVDLKSKLNDTNNKAENNHLDFLEFNERMAEFRELINEKVSMEIASLKLEFASGFDNMKTLNKAPSKSLFSKNPVKKAKDKIGVVEFKSELTPPKPELKSLFSKNPVKKSKDEIEMVEFKSELTPPKPESKLKKVARWLFVDEVEDDNEIKDIKFEVEKSKIDKKNKK